MIQQQNQNRNENDYKKVLETNEIYEMSYESSYLFEDVLSSTPMNKKVYMPPLLGI